MNKIIKSVLKAIVFTIVVSILSIGIISIRDFFGVIPAFIVCVAFAACVMFYVFYTTD